MKIEIKPLRRGWLDLPAVKPSCVHVCLGRLRIGFGFWRFCFHRMPTFTYQRFRNDEVWLYELRVWRVFVGAFWEKS